MIIAKFYAENVIGKKPMKKIALLWIKRIVHSRQRPEYADQSENGPSGNSGHDIEYVTRIYGGGIETGKI